MRKNTVPSGQALINASWEIRSCIDAVALWDERYEKQSQRLEKVWASRRAAQIRLHEAEQKLLKIANGGDA